MRAAPARDAGTAFPASRLAWIDLPLDRAWAWAGAVLGGIAMGCGARLSNECTSARIPAPSPAIAAGNLSGWAWMVLALAGSWTGVKPRPPFALAQRAGGPVC